MFSPSEREMFHILEQVQPPSPNGETNKAGIIDQPSETGSLPPPEQKLRVIAGLIWTKQEHNMLNFTLSPSSLQAMTDFLFDHLSLGVFYFSCKEMT